MRSSSTLAILAALAASTSTPVVLAAPAPMPPIRREPKPRVWKLKETGFQGQHDPERLAAAIAKRERKLAKRAREAR